MIQSPLTLARNNTNVLRVTGFYDQINGTFPVDAVITLTLFSPSGVALTGATALPVAYRLGTGLNSVYQVEVPYTVTLVSKTTCSAEFTGTKGGKRWFVAIPAKVE